VAPGVVPHTIAPWGRLPDPYKTGARRTAAHAGGRPALPAGRGHGGPRGRPRWDRCPPAASCCGSRDTSPC